METLFSDPRVKELLGAGLTRSVEEAFGMIDIAEAEIAAARGGKTEADPEDPLWTAFPLLVPSDGLIRTEVVFRAHVRELLERVKEGKDTRPGTDAEIVSAISRASYSFPLQRSLVGLQGRLFKRRFPELFEQLDGVLDVVMYERMYGPEIDELEAQLRRQATNRERRQP